MRTNYEVRHTIKIDKKWGTDELIFSFIDEAFGKNIKITMDEYDLKLLAEQIRNYIDKLEEESVTRLQNLRIGMGYSNSQPEVTYKNPNQ